MKNGKTTIAMKVWNEFITKAGNNEFDFSYSEFEKRINSEILEILSKEIPKAYYQGVLNIPQHNTIPVFDTIEEERVRIGGDYYKKQVEPNYIK